MNMAILAATMTGANAPRFWAADLAIFVVFGGATALALWSWHPSFGRFWAGFRSRTRGR